MTLSRRRLGRSARQSAPPDRRCRAVLALALLLALVAPSSADTLQANAPGTRPLRHVIRARGDAAFPPFEFLDERGRPTGFDIELLREVARVMGLEVSISLGPWDEVRSDLEAGRVDVLSGMFYSREREKRVDFSVPHVVLHHAIFVRRGSPVESLADLRGKAVLVQQGDIMHDLVRAERLTDRIVAAATPAEALRRLASGAHDAALLLKAQGLYQVERLGLSNVTTVGDPVAATDYCFAVQEGDRLLLAKLDEGLSILKATGAYKRLYDKWFGIYERPAGPGFWSLLRVAGWIVLPLALLAAAGLLWSWTLRKQVALRTKELERELDARRRAEEHRRRLEEQLRQAQKLQAIGQLAGGIAHDFNNVLTGIVGNAELLRLRMEEGTPGADEIHGIIRGSRRAADLIRQLLAFARKGKYQSVSVDLDQTVENTIQLLSRSIDRRIAIHRDLRATDAWVQGDPAQLENALLNLGLNARDAMEDGGELTFVTEEATLPERDAPSLPPGRYLHVTVRDTGHGIPAEIRERVFEPFFTTKEPGKGTGLGLASVYGCVEGHGGALDFRSEPGQGTEFHIWLPRADRSPRPANPVSRPVLTGSGRVLVVDDEETVREVASRALARLGYEVTTAADGPEAVRQFTERHEEIDLVLLDMMMPGLSGPAVFREMRRIAPEVPVLLTSGYAEDADARACLAEGARGFLAKPFPIRELGRVVAAHVRASAGAAPVERDA